MVLSDAIWRFTLWRPTLLMSVLTFSSMDGIHLVFWEENFVMANCIDECSHYLFFGWYSNGIWFTVMIAGGIYLLTVFYI